MATSFNSFSNLQQVPSYQQTQPGSTPQAPSQNLVDYAKPVGGSADAPDDEDFYARLQRQQAAASAPSTSSNINQSAAPAAGQVSPVSSNGRLTTAPAQVAPPPAPAAPAAAAPATTAPPLQPQGGEMTPQQAAAAGLGWVDKNNPNYGKPGFVGSTPASGGQPAGAPAAAPPPYAGYQAPPGVQLGNTPFSTYQGTNIQVGLPNAAPATQFSQWGGFDEGQQGASQQALINQILQNPHSMSDAGVAALKEQQKESASSIQKQLMGQSDSRAAARGVLGGSGNEGQHQQIASDFGQHLLGSYRDIDLQRMQQDRADELGALNASDALMQTRFGRANQGYQNTLAGQHEQEGANQFQSQFGLNRAGLDFNVQNANAQDRRAVADSQFNAQDAGLRRDIAQGGFNMDSWNNDQNRIYNAGNDAANRGTENRRIDVQSQLGNAGIGVDQAKLAEQGREFDQGHQLDFLNYLQRGSQFDDQQGLDWTKMNWDNMFRGMGA